MYRPYVKNEKGHPFQYYDTALIDLIKNLKKQKDLLRYGIVFNRLKENKNQILALENEETEILSYVHNNLYHKYKEPIYSKEGN